MYIGVTMIVAMTLNGWLDCVVALTRTGQRRDSRPGRRQWSGKSTLVKILSGYLPQDSGHLFVKGHEVLKLVQDAAAHGIEIVYQDLALIPQQPVFENFFLNREILHAGLFHVLNKRKMRELTKRCLDRSAHQGHLA